MIKRISNLLELTEYLPHLYRLLKERPHLFDEDMTDKKLTAMLMESLNNPTNFLAGDIENGELMFFLGTTDIEGLPDCKLIFLVYSHPKNAKFTKAYIDYCKTYSKLQGVTRFRACSNRFTRSYRRFVAQHGGKLIVQTYEYHL